MLTLRQMNVLEKKQIDVKTTGGKWLPLMEEFYSIQGEGFNTGKPAYFIRIGGCDVGCHWCDVKESWDANLHPLTETDRMVENIVKCAAKAVVVTGGEPCMYDLTYLTRRLKENNILIFLETSGAYEISGVWDWVCLSPKKNMPVLKENFAKASELKVIVYNKDDIRFAEMQAVEMNVGKATSTIPLFLQPEWSRRNEMIPLIIDYVQHHPKWRISLQAHKYIGIP